MLASPEELLQEGPILAAKLAPLRALLETQSVSPALYGALWAITALRVRHPYGWWGAHRRDALTTTAFDIPWSELPITDWTEDEHELLVRYPTLGQLLNHRAFRATPEAVHRALLNWELGNYPLVLMDRIPSVREVLAQQVEGKRCVTFFHQQAQLSKLVLGERDPLGFAFHDLIHADHFFHQNSLRQGQIGFYRQVARMDQAELLKDWMVLEDFPHRLEYLMADMNSHPLHLWKCFKAICHMTRPAETVTLFENTLPEFLELSELERESLRLMNSQEFVLKSHGVAVTDLCEKHGI